MGKYNTPFTFLGLYYHNAMNSRYISRNNCICLVYEQLIAQFSKNNDNRQTRAVNRQNWILNRQNRAVNRQYQTLNRQSLFTLSAPPSRTKSLQSILLLETMLDTLYRKRRV